MSEKMKILIVDDERANILELTNILKPEYTVLVAKDGEHALEIARSGSPDLILLDIIMPGKSGIDVLTELKSDDSVRHIPVIFITGRDSVEDEATGFFLGAVDYITKPFHSIIVKARVKNHLKTVEHMRTIERLGMIDALTDILNRRGFDKQIANEWERAVREKKVISAMLIDIDHFKDYNDRFGHPQGDELLAEIAEVLKVHFKRPSDCYARWGGDEFIAILPNTFTNGAVEVAEGIRAEIEKKAIQNGEGKVITVSIGISTAAPQVGSSIEHFVSTTDRALYTAKKEGRNRVCTL